MRKILYSPGFGAGWTTWSKGEMAKYMLTYQPIIDAIERGEKIDDSHPAVLQLAKECEEKFGDSPYLGGAEDLRVYKASGRVHIKEYDGSESIVEEGVSEDYWL